MVASYFCPDWSQDQPRYMLLDLELYPRPFGLLADVIATEQLARAVITF